MNCVVSADALRNPGMPQSIPVGHALLGLTPRYQILRQQRSLAHNDGEWNEPNNKSDYLLVKSPVVVVTLTVPLTFTRDYFCPINVAVIKNGGTRSSLHVLKLKVTSGQIGNCG